MAIRLANSSERKKMQARYVHPEQEKLPAAHAKQHYIPASKLSDVSMGAPQQKTHMAPTHLKLKASCLHWLINARSRDLNILSVKEVIAEQMEKYFTKLSLHPYHLARGLTRLSHQSRLRRNDLPTQRPTCDRFLFVLLSTPL